MNNNNNYFFDAWNFKDEIFKKEKIFLKSSGKFILYFSYSGIYKKITR